MHELIATHFTLFRSLLFLCCVGYWYVMYQWLRPSSEVLKKSCVATMAQFWVGLLTDIGWTQLGFWTYQSMPFALAGVPIDLHLNWSLLWGFGIIWLAERLFRSPPKRWQWHLYIGAWTGFTVSLDLAMVNWLVFLDEVSVWWWLGDICFLWLILSFTLWFYYSIGKADSDRSIWGGLPPISSYTRALISLSFLLFLFFIYLPNGMEALAAYLGHSVSPQPIPLIPQILLILSFALGGWATHEFARQGDGTPLPWDPPLQLVTSGPYAFVANPMQISGLLLCVALLCFRPSWVMLVYLVDVAIVVVVFFNRFEPHFLDVRFGEQYQAYRQRVPLWRASFFPRRIPEHERLLLIFDDQCGLCQNIVQAMLAIDPTHQLRICGFSDPKLKQICPHLPERFSTDSLVLWEPGNGLDGVGCFSVRSRAVFRVLGRTSFPICLNAAWEGIPGFCFIADKLYQWLAKHRHAVVEFSPTVQKMLQADERYVH